MLCFLKKRIYGIFYWVSLLHSVEETRDVIGEAQRRVHRLLDQPRMKSLHLVSETVMIGTELERRQARVDVQAVVSNTLLGEESL